MAHPLDYPFDCATILRRKKSLRRKLTDGGPFLKKKIAVLGGSTTAEIKDLLDLFLLHKGIAADFYECEYNKFYEDVMFENKDLVNFKPDLVYVHTTQANILRFPAATDKAPQVKELIAAEMARFTDFWDKLDALFSCQIIQNNFEPPVFRLFGNLDAVDPRGRTAFVHALNRSFAQQSAQRSSLYLHDLHYLASRLGLDKWHDRRFWFLYKYALAYDLIPELSYSVATLVSSLLGKSKKCLVTDLDNTLWGGIIGDDGVDGIQIGKETPDAEAFTELQLYMSQLQKRGVLLAACSKNEEDAALSGLSHPDSVLSIDDFTVFTANWNPKSDNIDNIARSINIGRDALVFIDDNPAEREIVSAQLPEVAVPDVGGDICDYVKILDRAGFFETASLSQDDLKRSAYYADNAQRSLAQATFKDYGQYLDSLEMEAEIKPFASVYYDRISQLINKSNQFNPTTRRYSLPEVTALAHDDKAITLYGRLKDKFGDNGVVSVVIATEKDRQYHVDLWVMSCRVLKRDMEQAMMDSLVAQAAKRGASVIRAFYYPSPKNKMVRKLFEELGFSLQEEDAQENSQWIYTIPPDRVNLNQHIKVTGG